MHTKEEQASANNGDFDKYVNKFLDAELPLVIKGCNMNEDGLTRLNDKTFGKYMDEYAFSYKRVPTNGDYLAIIKLGTADCLLPILTTYNLAGDKIDEKSLAIGYCGSDCGYTCEEFMSLERINTEEYLNWVKELKEKILTTQIKAAITVNKELLTLYWELGKAIYEKIKDSDWSSVVEVLAKDLKKELPNQKGFSRSNLFSMKKWYEFYSRATQGIEKVQQVVGQIPWGHNVMIISKASSVEEALFYVRKTLENNWSRSVLTHQIELGLYHRQGKAITNFEKTLPETHSELAHETLKDPYKFDFLTLQEKALEKDIEDQLVQHITSFLLELGAGFAFVGRQVPIKIDDKDFYIDLLFYHIKLRCYVVVELKSVEFKAEFAGKMNLYLSAADDTWKSETDNPSIGLLLCKSKSRIIAEYALRGMTQPIGIAEYELTKAIPENIKSNLPTIEEIEKATTKAMRNAP